MKFSKCDFCFNLLSRFKTRDKKWKNPDTHLSLSFMHCMHTGAKILNLSRNSQNLIFHKIHNFKISFFTKFTSSKSHFWQNSYFQNLIFDKIHIFKVSFLNKSYFSDPIMERNEWSFGLPASLWRPQQCDSAFSIKRWHGRQSGFRRRDFHLGYEDGW